jgi:aspartyl protease family protein
MSQTPPPRSPFRFFAIVAILLALAVALAAGSSGGTTLGLSNYELGRAGYLVALLVFVGSALFGRGLGLGYAVRAAISWLVALLILVGSYAYRDELGVVGGRILGALAPGVPISGRFSGERDSAVVINRGLSGHFAVRANVDSQRMLMMVDTGASFVTLTNADAAAIGVDTSALSFTVPVQTANGMIRAAPIVIDRLAIGSILRTDVRALVAPPKALDQSLLGMSFLDTLASYAIAGDRLVLTP